MSTQPSFGSVASGVSDATSTPAAPFSTACTAKSAPSNRSPLSATKSEPAEILRVSSAMSEKTTSAAPRTMSAPAARTMSASGNLIS